jgi:hypothetical protein
LGQKLPRAGQQLVDRLSDLKGDSRACLGGDQVHVRERRLLQRFPRGAVERAPLGGNLLAGAEAYTLVIDASQLDPFALSPGLPAVIAPDAVDLTLSPGSIGLVPHLLKGHGLCGQLMPTTMAVRRFDAFRILADVCHPRTLPCGVQIVRGRMLEFEIAWHPAGTALGELLNSNTLAPCEQVNVAVVDWMR